jgi:chromosome segregation ATPase
MTMPSCNGINTSAANAANILNADTVGSYPGALTPDALMIYLQTRLESVDNQINQIFDQQQKMEKIRSLLNKIQDELNKLNDKAEQGQLQGTKHGGGPQDYEAKIEGLLDQIAELDPHLADQMRTDMRSEGQILWVEDGLYWSQEVSTSKDYVNSMLKDIEASAQMNMIRLQSMMSSRQTAIQLSTNLINNLHEGAKSIVGNIR